MKKNRLLGILDKQVLREGKLEQLQAIAFLVKRCLSINSSDRPTMKEVAVELDGLKDFTQHPWANQNDNEDGISLINRHSDLYDVPVGSSIRSLDNFGQYSSDQILSVMNLEK